MGGEGPCGGGSRAAPNSFSARVSRGHPIVADGPFGGGSRAAPTGADESSASIIAFDGGSIGARYGPLTNGDFHQDRRREELFASCREDAEDTAGNQHRPQ